MNDISIYWGVFKNGIRLASLSVLPRSLDTLFLITGFLNFPEFISTLFDRIIARVDVTVSPVV